MTGEYPTGPEQGVWVYQPITPEPAPEPQPAPAPPTQKTRRWILPLITGVVGVALGIGGTLLIPAIFGSGTIHVDGTITVADVENVQRAGYGSCESTGGYNDLNAGGQVVITDDSGQTLAITHLGEGQYDDETGYCDFPFVAEVPAGRDYYGVTVTHRNTVKESESDLPYVSLSIGDDS